LELTAFTEIFVHPKFLKEFKAIKIIQFRFAHFRNIMTIALLKPKSATKEEKQ